MCIRDRYLDAAEAEDFDLGGYLEASGDAAADRAKQIIVREGLHLRRQHADVFLRGEHQAVFAVGQAHEHLVGIARGDAAVGGAKGLSVIALATRRPLALETAGGWGETTVQLPEGDWVDRLTGRTYSGVVPVADVLATLPTAMLVSARLTEASRL